MIGREEIPQSSVDDGDIKQEKDDRPNLPRRSPFVSLTSLYALPWELEWKRISKMVKYDVNERAKNISQNFSNGDRHRICPTPKHAETQSQQHPLLWFGSQTRCQRHVGDRFQSASTPNEMRHVVGGEEITQSSVSTASGALIGRERRVNSSASAKKERPLLEFEFEGAQKTFTILRAAASIAASMAMSVLLHFPINPSVSLHRHENRRLGCLTALLIP